MRQRGFTLVEMVVVLGIVTVLFVAAAPSFWNFLNRYQLDAHEEKLVQALRLAQHKSMTGEDDSVWSVRLSTGAGGSFTVYRGSNYAGRDSEYDEVHALPSALTLSTTTPDSDITFGKLDGTTTDTGNITLTWPDGNDSRVVSVNAAGRIDGP